MRNIGLICSLFLFCSILNAQQDAWVYLADKENVSAAIANPISILSQKAIDRKNLHGILIDSRDVPVNENYITQLKNASGILVMAKSKWFNAVHVRGSQSDIQSLTSLSFVNGVDFADKTLSIKQKKAIHTAKQSKLENTSATFNYGNSSNQIEMIKGDDLHLLDYTGTGMTVAVIDAGFPNANTMGAFARFRNTGNLLGSYDFVNRDMDVFTNTTSNHGTLVLSTMVGYIENEFVGTAPDAAYYLFITEDATSENPVEESYWVEAAERADSLGVDVINTSLGYTTYDNPNYSYTANDMDGNTTYITRGANIAFEKGLLLINSAGNSGGAGNPWQIVGAPADAEGVFSIGAVDNNGNYASFSSKGNATQPNQKPDVVAQGLASSIITENNIVSTANGTSFSGPIMAGGLVCLWQALPNKTNAEIMQLVRASASQYTTPDNFLGYGIPDLQLALNTSLSVTGFKTQDISVYPNPIHNLINFNFSDNKKDIDVVLYNILGEEILISKVSITQNSMDVSTLPNGLYILKFNSNGITKSIKIIKD